MIVEAVFDLGVVDLAILYTLGVVIYFSPRAFGVILAVVASLALIAKLFGVE